MENYKTIKKIEVNNIPINTQWIFLTGENAHGKTSILRAIVLGLNNNKYITDNEECKITLVKKEEPEVEIITPEIKKFNNFATYGTKRLDLSDKYIPKNYESLFELKDALYDFETKYKDLKLFSANKTKFENFENLLTSIVPDLSRIDIEQKNSRVVYYELSETEKESKPIFFKQLAIGMRNIINMISDLVFHLSNGTFDFKFENNVTDLHGIVIIDEFDNHLHPKWQRDLVVNFSKLFPKVQFIVSTHSPFPLLGAPKNTVILNVQRIKGEITVKRLEQIEKELPNLLPNTLLTSPLFGLDSIKSVENKDIREVVVDEHYNDRLKYQVLEKKIDNLFKKNNWENNDLFKE